MPKRRTIRSRPSGGRRARPLLPPAALPPNPAPPDGTLESEVRSRIHAPFSVIEFSDEDDWWAAEVYRRTLRMAAFASIENPKDRESTIEAERELCRRDTVYWAENWAWLYDPKQPIPMRRELPAVLWPRQRELIKFLANQLALGRSAVVPKGRELGVSWCALLIIYNLFRTEWGFSAKIGSRKEEFVDDYSMDSLFGKLRYIHDRMPDFLKPTVRDNFCKFRQPGTQSEIAGEATNAGFGRGGRRRIMLLDEFAHVMPETLQAAVFTSIETVATSTWFVSSPNGPGNKFANLVRESDPANVFPMEWTSDPRRPADFKTQKLLPIGNMTDDEFEQEHCGKIVTLRGGRVWNVRRLLTEYWDECPDFVAIGGAESRKKRMIIGGWDFGSGASLLVFLGAILEMGPRPRLWIDRELVWQQTSWRIAAADVRSLFGSEYSSNTIHYGDPAGRQKDSAQESWESHLRSGGVPLICLGDESNTRDAIEWAIKRGQTLFSDGLVRVHRRCEYFWNCIDNWSRDIPKGVEVDYISRAYIPPRRDVYSHGGMAYLYLITGANLSIESMKNAQHEALGALDKLPTSPVGSILGALEHSTSDGDEMNWGRDPSDAIFPPWMGGG